MDFWQTCKGIIQNSLMVACLWAGLGSAAFFR